MRVIVWCLLLPLCAGRGDLCPSNQFWSSRLTKCVDCSRCKKTEVAKRPCQQYTDTICGPLSDLNIDWSWMPKREKSKDDIREGKGKQIEIEFPEKKHKKHSRKHFEYPSDAEEEEKRQRKNSKFRRFESPSFPAHRWEESGGRGKQVRFEDEKELERWLLASREKLLHRKADLMKTLKEETQSGGGSSSGGIKLNHPIHKIDAKLYRDLLDHESHIVKKKKQQHREDLDLQAFRDLLGDEGDDVESVLDFRHVVPTHRLYLGESSEVAGRHESKDERDNRDEDTEDEAVKEVASAPFTTAETFVWDWQAFLFVAAGASCVLFVVAVLYTLLNARQWRKVKIKFESDPDEMSSKLALMPSSLDSSASDGNSTGRYLEQLLATQNLDDRKENIYINDKSCS